MSAAPLEPTRILIVRIGAMGDVLHAMPAVAGLRSALPGVRIGWAIEPRWTSLLRNAQGSMPLIDRLHMVPATEWKRSPFSRQTLSGIVELRRELQAERYDLCFDLQGAIKSAVIASISGARAVIGAAHPREEQAKFFYKRALPVSQENVIDQACELLSAGLGREIVPAPVALPVDTEAELWCDRLVEVGAGRGKDSVLLTPTAGWGAKEWGSARFAHLAVQLRRSGYRVLVNKPAGAAAGVAEQIAIDSGAEIVESNLPQMIALTRRAALVVGGDTGPLHLAAALGRPVVALFGPTDPRRNGPQFPGALARVLRSPQSQTSHKRLSETEKGLDSVTVEEVLSACLQMLTPR